MSLDASCGANSYHVSYPGANFSATPQQYVFPNGTAVINQPPTPCLSPCVLFGNSTTQCHTLACYQHDSGSAPQKCESFAANLVAGCYCESIFLEKVAALGLVTGTQWVIDNESALCGTFAQNLLLNYLSSIQGAIIVVVVNLVLKEVLNILGKFEHLSSVTAELLAILKKIFVAQVLFLSSLFHALIIVAAFQHRIFSSDN